MHPTKSAMVEYFDSVAPDWESLASDSTARAVKSVMSRWKRFIGPSVLDVGAGTGRLVPFLTSAADVTYTGLELSAGMIREFRKNHPHRRIVRGDVEEERTLEGELFDTIVVFNTFPLFNSPGRAIRNCRRLLRAGGSILIGQDRPRNVLIDARRKAKLCGRRYTLPSDAELRTFCSAYGLRQFELVDAEYFSLVLVADPVAVTGRERAIPIAPEESWTDATTY